MLNEPKFLLSLLVPCNWGWQPPIIQFIPQLGHTDTQTLEKIQVRWRGPPDVPWGGGHRGMRPGEVAARPGEKAGRTLSLAGTEPSPFPCCFHASYLIHRHHLHRGHAGGWDQIQNLHDHVRSQREQEQRENLPGGGRV